MVGAIRKIDAALLVGCQFLGRVDLSFDCLAAISRARTVPMLLMKGMVYS